MAAHILPQRRTAFCLLSAFGVLDCCSRKLLCSSVGHTDFVLLLIPELDVNLNSQTLLILVLTISLCMCSWCQAMSPGMPLISCWTSCCSSATSPRSDLHPDCMTLLALLTGLTSTLTRWTSALGLYPDVAGRTQRLKTIGPLKALSASAGDKLHRAEGFPVRVCVPVLRRHCALGPAHVPVRQGQLPRGLGGSMVAPTYHDAGRNASFAISLLVYFPMQDALCRIACFLQNTGRCRTLQQCEDVTLSCRQDDL